jgi:hypothetical protein
MNIDIEGNRKSIVEWLNGITRVGITDLIAWLQWETDFFSAPCSTNYHLAVPGGLAQHSLNVMNILNGKLLEYCPPVSDGAPPVMESAVICGIGHDFGKIGMYKSGGDLAQGRQLSWTRELLEKNIKNMTTDEITLLDLRNIVARLGKVNDNTTAYTVNDDIPKEHASNIIGWLKDGYRPGTMPEFPITYGVDDKLPMGHGEKAVYLLSKFIPLTDEEILAIRWHMGAFDPYVHNYPWNKQFEAAVKMTPLVPILINADYEATNVLEAFYE